MTEKEYTVKLTKNQIEELIHATITSYMEYDERLFKDKVLQEQYNEGVTKYNNMIDEIRHKLKEAIGQY